MYIYIYVYEYRYVFPHHPSWMVLGRVLEQGLSSTLSSTLSGTLSSTLSRTSTCRWIHPNFNDTYFYNGVWAGMICQKTIVLLNDTTVSCILKHVQDITHVAMHNMAQNDGTCTIWSVLGKQKYFEDIYLGYQMHN